MSLGILRTSYLFRSSWFMSRHLIRYVNSRAQENTEEKIKTEPTPEELEKEEPWMQKELIAYYRGKNLLAKMMGSDPETFTEKDVEEAICYLLPSSLTAKDARPSLKHPSKIFPKRKDAAFDSQGRPLESSFYTGFPAYYNLIYEIYQNSKLLDISETETKTDSKPLDPEHVFGETETKTDSKPLDPEHVVGETETKTDSKLVTDSASGEEILEILAPEPVSRGTETETQDLSVEMLTQDTSSDPDNENITDSDKQDMTKVPPLSSSTQTRWVKKDTFSNIIAEELTDEQYQDLINRLSILSSHKNSHLISEFLDIYRRPVFLYRSQANLPKINSRGYSYSVGRRKTSVAQVWLKEGCGNIIVNKRRLTEFFPRVEDRQQVLYPFLVIDQLGKWNVEARVQGGGTTGHAGALRLGISKALLGFPGNHSNLLENAGLLIRDPRMVERKKPGQKKARKKFAWVKR